jgi:hypothetical protein
MSVGRDIPGNLSRGLLVAPEVFARRIGVSVSFLKEINRVYDKDGWWSRKIRWNEEMDCEELTENWTNGR